MNVFNKTEHTLTIYYDNPNLPSGFTDEQIQRVNTLGVLDAQSNGGFVLPGSECASVDIVALDEDDNVVDRLPAGTCHTDETVDWTISAP